MSDLVVSFRQARGGDPASVSAIVSAAAREVGATDLVIYLVDFEQTTLEPLSDHMTHADLPHSESVTGTMAGRAFLGQSAVTADRDDAKRVWVPVLEGSDRTGVLALTVRDTPPETLKVCEELGLLAGYLIATQARYTDVFNLHRRRKAMTLPASLQWDLLPPLLFNSASVTVAGLLEPAYEVGGDCFDYAVNGGVLDFALMDAMGHGLGSAMVAALAIGCYRHSRREGRPLEFINRELNAIISSQWSMDAFLTGQLVQLDLVSGELTMINAGHHLPLHLRAGKVLGQISCPPGLPWGLGESTQATPTTTHLEPGDSVVFYTDGVVDARRAGRPEFGVGRLAELAGRATSESVPTEEVVRQLLKAVVEHHDHDLADDATIAIIRWHGTFPASPASSPG